MPELLMGSSARPFDAMKALEEPRQLVRRDAHTGKISHGQQRLARAPAQADRDAAHEGKALQGIRQQVEHDLLPHIVVDVDRLRQRFAFDLEGEAGALDGRTEMARQIDGERAQISRLIRRARASRLDACERSNSPLTSFNKRRLVPVHGGFQVRAGECALWRAQSVFGGSCSIKVNGVRNSWLTFEKNAVFARSI